MKQKSNRNFKPNFKLLSSSWRLVFKIIRVQILFAVLSYALAQSIHPLSTLAVGLLNLFASIWIFIEWTNHYYILTEEGISKTHGVLYRKTRTFDMASIASVKVRQGLLGRLFHYGHIVLENPLTKKDLVLRSIENPYEQASLIEQQRLKEISKQSSKVVPL